MADEKARDQKHDNEPNKGRAMGAEASANYQGQDQYDSQRNPQPSEMAGQGGGIQGSGQRQPNPGGFTEGENRERDEGRDYERSAEIKRKE